MRPEDLVAFAAGAAAVPLWQPLPAVSESNMPRHVGYVYNMLMVCKAAQQKRFSDLPTKQQEVFKANLLEFLEKNQFIAKGARTGADWPAAALAGLFAGAALQAVREQRRVAALKKNEEAQKYYNELSGTFYQKLAHPEDSNELCLPVVRLVVFFFVWKEYPQDLDLCRERLDALEPTVAQSCLALLRPPDEWTSLQGAGRVLGSSRL